MVPHQRRGSPRQVEVAMDSGVCPGQAGSEQGPAPAPPALVLIWHLPEVQPEALNLLWGLTSHAGVLCPCGRHSHWEPAAGIHRSPLLGSLAGPQTRGEGQLHHVAITSPVVERAVPSLP